MRKRELLSILVLGAILLTTISSATTASIGNSRMVLSLSPGETIERSVLVRNTNDFPVTITLSADGDLKDKIDLEETEFTLSKGEEKKAYFTIKAQKSGTTESKINVLFTPEEGNSVGLLSTIIVTIKGSSEDNFFEDSETPTENLADSNTGVSFKVNPSNTPTTSDKKKLKVSPIILLSFSTLILVAIFLALVIYSSTKVKKSGLTKPKERASKIEK